MDGLFSFAYLSTSHVAEFKQNQNMRQQLSDRQSRNNK
jgi:hypothetical protein